MNKQFWKVSFGTKTDFFVKFNQILRHVVSGPISNLNCGLLHEFIKNYISQKDHVTEAFQVTS